MTYYLINHIVMGKSILKDISFSYLENDRSCAYKKVVPTKSELIGVKMISMSCIHQSELLILEYAYATGLP